MKVYYLEQELEERKDYSLSYLNNRGQGYAIVVIKGTNHYSGEIEKEFLILAPKKKTPKIKALRSTKSKILLKFVYERDGKYKVQYSIFRNMKKSKTIMAKSSDIKIKKLKVGKVYYVRLGMANARKTTWSKVNKIKVK